MKTHLLAITALALSGTFAQAGEIERRGDPSVILFEKGKKHDRIKADFATMLVASTAVLRNATRAVCALPTLPAGLTIPV